MQRRPLSARIAFRLPASPEVGTHDQSLPKSTDPSPGSHGADTEKASLALFEMQKHEADAAPGSPQLSPLASTTVPLAAADTAAIVDRMLDTMVMDADHATHDTACKSAPAHIHVCVLLPLRHTIRLLTTLRLQCAAVWVSTPKAYVEQHSWLSHLCMVGSRMLS